VVSTIIKLGRYALGRIDIQEHSGEHSIWLSGPSVLVGQEGVLVGTHLILRGRAAHTFRYYLFDFFVFSVAVLFAFVSFRTLSTGCSAGTFHKFFTIVTE
jgi:hypothetical protein